MIYLLKSILFFLITYFRYISELKEKIELKLIPNKTEEQILCQFFRFYDLESLGLCNFQNFIKTNERLGLVFKRTNEIEKIFNYFDSDNDGYINYKKFANDIFKNQNFNQNKKNENLNNFISILNKKLIENGGNLALIKLIKSFQIIDYNDSKRLSIDDFLKVLNECHLGLNSFEMQFLFQEYNLFSNGIILYYKIIESILSIYWDNSRNNLSEDFYNHLTEFGKKNISLNDIRNIYLNTPNDNYKKEIFMHFLDDYKFITSAYNDKPLSLNDIKKFVKFFGFGIESTNELRELLFELDEQKIVNPEIEMQYNFNNNNNNDNYNNNKKIQFHNYKNENKLFEKNIEFNDNIIKNRLNNALVTLRKYLIKYGRKTFFNFIKHFKYYDNNTKTINKYDFVKVLKDFNINIPLLDIENLFNEYGINHKKNLINYIDLLKQISESTLNQSREDVIRDSLNKLFNIANQNNCPITLNLLKNIYNPKNNYFIGDQTENKNDYENCLELYHYFFKGYKNDIFAENEFIEFYHFISYLIEKDYDFISLLNNEWSLQSNNTNNEIENEKIISNKNNFVDNNNINQLNNREIIQAFNDKYKNENDKIENENLDNLSTKNNPRTPYQRIEKNNYENENNEINNILEKLKQKLRIRGIRGLLYLHRQFLISCENLMKITYNDFKNVLQAQHILFNEKEYQILFNNFSKDNFLLFSNFIREFKKQLNNNKLNYVEDAYSILDNQNNGIVTINQIKMNYDARNHPDVISGKKNDEEKLLEFIDCFQINNDILNYDNNNQSNIIDFEIFANFYEYVAFVYENDNIFGNIIFSTFHQ